MAQASQGLSAWIRFTCTLTLLSLPFWLFGSLPLPGPAVGLPVSALMVVCPAVAAALLVRHDGAGDGWRERLRMSGPGRWSGSAWVLYVATMPLVVLLAAALGGTSPTKPPASGWWSGVLVLLVPLLLAATLEEIGWTAWLLPRLRLTWGRAPAGLLIGLTWGVWHAVPYLQAGNAVAWVVGQVLFSTIFRLFIVEAIAGTTAPLLGAVLMHAGYNLAWQGLLAAGGTYSPWATTGVTVLALLVLLSMRYGRRRLDGRKTSGAAGGRPTLGSRSHARRHRHDRDVS